MKPSDLTLLSAKLPLSKSTLARNSFPRAYTASGQPATARRIRQKRGGPSKLEMEWFAVHERAWESVRHQSITLTLANGLRYTPDFVCLSATKTMLAHEIKGPHAFDGSLDKLKMAAHEWPEIRFYLWWKKDGVWCQQEVLP